MRSIFNPIVITLITVIVRGTILARRPAVGPRWLTQCTTSCPPFYSICDLKLIDITGCFKFIRILIMATSSRRRCLNELNAFSYICDKCMLEHNRKAFSNFVRRAYLAYL